MQMKTWGIAATLGFGVLAFAFGQGVGIAAVSAAMGFDPSRTAGDGSANAIFLLVGNPVQVITLALAVRMTGAELWTYFALDLPPWRDVAAAVVALAVAILAVDVLTLASGRDLVPSFQLQAYRSAQTEGVLIPLWLAVIAVAPVGEEMLFRGFLFRGLVRERRDALPGIVAIALIWSLLHSQYDLFGTSLVFAIGVLFGYVRLYSGSTTLVILLHMLLNVESLLETIVAAGWA